MATRTLELVRRMNARRLATLTLASSDDPLGEQIDRMSAAFRTLRRSAFWKQHVDGGVWAIEVTYNVETGRWHPHVHIIMDGSYIPQADLKAAWLKITGDSSVVDVRKCDDARDAARYIATYVGKLADLLRVPAARVIDYADALHRRRLAGTFGTSHAHTLERKDDAEEPRPAEFIITAATLTNAALSGNDDAGYAISVLCSLGRRWCDIFGERWSRSSSLIADDESICCDRAIAIMRSLADAEAVPHEEAKPPPPPRPPDLILFRPPPATL